MNHWLKKVCNKLKITLHLSATLSKNHSRVNLSIKIFEVRMINWKASLNKKVLIWVLKVSIVRAFLASDSNRPCSKVKERRSWMHGHQVFSLRWNWASAVAFPDWHDANCEMTEIKSQRYDRAQPLQFSVSTGTVLGKKTRAEPSKLFR